jgi:hypothetical protein
MILNTKERLILLASLPKEGDFTTLKIVRNLREDLSFSEEEYKVLNFVVQPNGGGVKWNDKGEKPKEISIGEKATDVIVDALKRLNAEKRLTEDHFALYEKFVGE